MSNLPTTNKFIPSDDELETVGKLAAANYSPESVAVYLDIPKEDFLAVFKDKDSFLRATYDRGKVAAEFAVIDKQRELAESGNITAAQVFLKESQRLKTEQIINDCFFG